MNIELRIIAHERICSNIIIFFCIYLCLHSGSTKHSIALTSQDEGNGPKVKDLSDAVCQVTGVPPASQKLIFKGILFILFKMFHRSV